MTCVKGVTGKKTKERRQLQFSFFCARTFKIKFRGWTLYRAISHQQHGEMGCEQLQTLYIRLFFLRLHCYI